MRRASREILLSFAAVLVCLTFLSVLVYSYEFTPTLFLLTQAQTKETPQKVAPTPAEPQNDEPKRQDPPVVQPKPQPPAFGGFRGFGKKARLQTLSDRMGVRLETPGEDQIVQLGLPEGEGLTVVDVREGLAAANVGLKVGDIIVELGGRAVPNEAPQFNFTLGDLKAGEALDVVILREGKMETLKGLVLPEPRPTGLQFKKKFAFPQP